MKKQNGFSFVEVIISMVVLAFVTLVIGVVLTTSVKQHKASYSEDEAYAIARQKLSQLQDPAAEVSATGTEVVSRSSVSYTVMWSVTAVANKPNRALITVMWGNSRQIQVAGFIEAQIATCPTINPNHAPTVLSVSPVSPAINQNSSVGTLVGTFSTTDVDIAQGDLHNYSFVSGGTNNSDFQISGNTLLTAVTFTASGSAYTKSVNVKTTDCGGLYKTQAFTITLNPVSTNNTPTDITLSNSSIAENQASGSTVGTFTTTDDAGQTHTYDLTGGYTDNSSFTITGNTLKTANSFNYESKSSYLIKVRSTDNGSPVKYLDKDFTITVTNVNEAPTDITLSASSIAENSGSNATIGTLTTTDSDAGQTFTYTLLAVGDYNLFNILGNALRENASFNYEATPTKTSFNLQIRSTDDGTPTNLYCDETFTISLNNVNEAPFFNTRKNNYSKNISTLDSFTISAATDPDIGNTIAYSDSSLPAGATFNTTTRKFSWTTPGTAFKDTMYFKAMDQGGLFDRDTVIVTVIGPQTYMMRMRALFNKNSSFSGADTGRWVGGYARHSSYTYEVLCRITDVSSLLGQTIDSTIFKFKIVTNVGSSSIIGNLYEQNKQTTMTSTMADTMKYHSFPNYTTAWGTSLGSKTSSATGTYEIPTSLLKPVVQKWANGQNNTGLILGANPAYWGYYWRIDSTRVIIWSH